MSPTLRLSSPFAASTASSGSSRAWFTWATAYGVAKAAGGYARFRRGRQQMWEAADESISDGSAKNLLGWLPSGQKYDDPGEPSFGGYWSGLYDRAREDYWGTAAEALGDFFAFPGDGE